MMSSFSFTVEIAGISIRFESPIIMEIPPELKPFLTDKTYAQEVYRIEFIHRPILFDTAPDYTSTGLNVYHRDGETYREFLHLKAADGCFPLCCLRSNGVYSCVRLGALREKLYALRPVGAGGIVFTP